MALYGLAGVGLYPINTGTGASTYVATTTEDFNGICFEPTTDTLYGVTDSGLYTINAGTGAVTYVGATSGQRITCITFDESTGGLLGFDGVARFSINTSTGAATYVSSEADSVTAVADDHPNGILYAMRGVGLYNLTTPGFIGSTEKPLNAIANNPADSVMFGIAGIGLYTVDLGTAALTYVGNTTERFQALSFTTT